MNYELAKQLKEAGFEEGSREVERADSWYDLNKVKSYWWDSEKDVYIPTLSELIEACGDEFDALYNQVRDWQAAAGDSEGLKEVCASGKTPLEAVAKLWLKLNKKCS